MPHDVLGRMERDTAVVFPAIHRAVHRYDFRPQRASQMHHRSRHRHNQIEAGNQGRRIVVISRASGIGILVNLRMLLAILVLQ